jgi:hypothetical protein
MSAQFERQHDPATLAAFARLLARRGMTERGARADPHFFAIPESSSMSPQAKTLVELEVTLRGKVRPA